MAMHKNFGVCDQCKKKITKFHLEGRTDGKRLRFCNLYCVDLYEDAQKKRSGTSGGGV